MKTCDKTPVNYIDETSWLMHGERSWLWVMASPEVAYFQIHPTRSKTAFVQLIADWTEILVSDGYLVYQHWQGLRQSCLAHLIRTAKGLAEHLELRIAGFRQRVHVELQRLCHMGTERPTVGQWRAWYARFRSLVNHHAARQDKAGTFARRLEREGESLWVFLDVQGVEATNNIAKRAHRFDVLWSKRSQGTCSEKGNRWVERVTCRSGIPVASGADQRFLYSSKRFHACSKARRPICAGSRSTSPHRSPLPRDQIQHVVCFSRTRTTRDD
jgi:transposase